LFPSGRLPPPPPFLKKTSGPEGPDARLFVTTRRYAASLLLARLLREVAAGKT
jgi:hypothetical protein